MNIPKPRSGYPHRAELNTKFHPAQSGIPDSTEFTVYCQDCADARLSIHGETPGILRRMEAGTGTGAEIDLETYMKDVISRHNSQFLRGALAWREINV